MYPIIINQRMLKLLIILSIPMLVGAETNSVVDRLMKEKASLFDLGMHRLETYNHYWEEQIASYYRYGSGSKNVAGNINEYYSDEEGIIHVSFSVSDLLASEAKMRAGCQAALGHVRVYIAKSLHVMFSHAGQVSGSRDVSELRSLFKLSCTVFGNSTENVRFNGEMNLNGGSIKVVKPVLPSK